MKESPVEEVGWRRPFGGARDDSVIRAAAKNSGKTARGNDAGDSSGLTFMRRRKGAPQHR
jgi:hypothetical protein